MLEKLPAELGSVLKGHRSGIENVVFHRLLAVRSVPRVELYSAFANMERIPVRFTADGDGISPALEWHGIPDAAGHLVLMVEDGDSPTLHPLVHAIAVNLDPERRMIGDGALVNGEKAVSDVQLGLNSLLKLGWMPPDPPPGHGLHRYAFQLFALAAGAALPSAAGRHEVAEAVMDRALAAGCLIGTYERLRRVTNDDTSEEAEVDVGLTPAMA